MNRSVSIVVQLGMLAGLSCLVQAWIIAQARLPALDAVNFAAHAQLIERTGLEAALGADSAPPLFPLMILTTRDAAVRLGVELDWAHAVQIAAAIPLVLLVVPVYVLAWQACGPREAPIAALLFVTMTQTARLGGDGLSDSPHLLGFCTVLAAGGAALSASRPGLQLAYGALAGLGIGLTMLVRGEVWILLPLILMAPLWVRRQAWPTRLLVAARTGLGMTAALAIVLGVYFSAVEPASADEALTRLLARRGYNEPHPLNASETAFGESPPLTGTLASGAPWQFGRKDPTISIRFHGAAQAVRRFTEELLHSWQYLVGLLAAVGCWQARARRWEALEWLHGLLFVGYSAALLYFATSHGYLERRHLLPLVVVSLPWAARGTLTVGAWCSRLGSALGAARLFPSLTPTVAQRLAAAVVVLACGSTTLLVPLHPGRAAHRQAAEWLQRHGSPGAVLDTVGHTALYTGRTTYRHEIAARALVDPALLYVVVESHELLRSSRRAETLRELLTHFAIEEARFAPPTGKAGPEVCIYRWDSIQFAFLNGLFGYAR